MITKPIVFKSKTFVDDRGQLVTFPEEPPINIKRFYIVSNHENCPQIRAFHGHKEESKLIIPIRGTILVYTCEIENKRNTLTKHILSSSNEDTGLYVPGGYYHGFKFLNKETSLLVLSDKTLNESLTDDYRLSWDIFGQSLWETQIR